MHLPSFLYTALIFAASSVNATFDLNVIANKVAEFIKDHEISAVNKFIDDIVQDMLADNAKIVRPPVKAKEAADGTLSFKILQIPDMHYTGNSLMPCADKPSTMKKLCFEPYMTTMIAKMLDDTKPDFVVFTGDQVESLWYPQTWLHSISTVDKYSAEVNKRQLPWAMVFGNHDESLAPQLFSNKKIMGAYIESLQYSYAKYGPFNIGGVGNYELSVQAPNSSDNVLRMYFMDTGKDGAVTPAQLNYTKSLAATHKGEDVPALMFFHIPTVEYAEYNNTGGQGMRRENPSGTIQSGIFDAMVAMGDVKASFCGHDHLNDFCFKRQSLHLCYGGAVGYGTAYAKPDRPRTARVIQWTKSATQESMTTSLYLQNTDNANDQYTLFERSHKAC
ncbi:calcineurin-like phosphoesterase [Achlya hypogyna]|uniref:Calcineurin-like phosphoesterase n=1 Tax=Achlya hypogyna TaxID=1202772 RepID=A0A0A7CPP2_ACHHY|nr:secreted protein [Achlya hypogyna]OQR82554.1 calcineurin-like phosphoesterase [Achlya hypogyna]